MCGVNFEGCRSIYTPFDTSQNVNGCAPPSACPFGCRQFKTVVRVKMHISHIYTKYRRVQLAIYKCPFPYIYAIFISGLSCVCAGKSKQSNCVFCLTICIYICCVFVLSALPTLFIHCIILHIYISKIKQGFCDCRQTQWNVYICS